MSAFDELKARVIEWMRAGRSPADAIERFVFGLGSLHIYENPILEYGQIVRVDDRIVAWPGGTRALMRKIRRKLARTGVRGRRGSRRIPSPVMTKPALVPGGWAP